MGSTARGGSDKNLLQSNRAIEASELNSRMPKVIKTSSSKDGEKPIVKGHKKSDASVKKKDYLS